MSAPKTIGIIGAAIAGPTLALQILSNKVLRSAFRPILLDQSAAPSASDERQRAGATVGLFANGLYPLYQLGLQDAIRQRGFECGQLSTWKCDSHGAKEMLNTQASAMWSHDLQTGVVYFERWALQSLLLDKVAELGGSVSWDKKAVAFDTLQDGRTAVTFEDGQTVTVDLLVGADGGYSAVRKFILNQKQPATAEERWLPDFMGMTGIYGVSKGVASPTSAARFGDTHLIWLDRGFLSSGPCPQGRIRWDLVLPEEEAPAAPEPEPSDPRGAAMAQGSEPWISSMVPSAYPRDSTVDILRKYRNVYHPYGRNLEALLQSADRIIRSPLRQRVWRQDELHRGNSVLMGDAARLMLPTSGQGTGFAVEDATVLASQLLKYASSRANGGQGGLHDALKEYARLRHPRSTKMAKMSSAAAKFSMGSAWYWRVIRYYASKLQPNSSNARSVAKFRTYCILMKLISS